MSPNDPNESSLSNLSPYRLQESENGYVFETDFGTIYELVFRDDADYFPGEDFLGPILSFAIALLDGEESAKDPKVEDTVAYVLQHTFEANPQTIISYTCYTSDGKAAARSRKFRIWYSRKGVREYERLEYENKDTALYAAVLFKKSHPFEKEIRRMFGYTYANK
jgi:hypothetical protein